MSDITTRFWFESKPIRDDGALLCLTDMWRAGGADESKRPAAWLRHDATQEFAAYLETVSPAHSLVQTTEGRTGGTWAHWQLALAYAKYLSPAFHAWCNEVVRAVMQGGGAGLAQPLDVRELRDELRELRSNVAALWGHISQGGYIARARFEALQKDWQELADIEVAVGLWPAKPAKPGKRARSPRSAALADIQRDMREHTEWGGKGKPWNELPAGLEPAVRAVINRRKKDALRRGPARNEAQLSLIKTG
jgi:hypothetical protein